MRFINDLGEGNNIQGVYLCKQKTSTVTKNGKPYDSVILQDKTGSIDAKIWDPYNPGIREFEAGDFVDVYGDVVMFNNAKQERLTNVRRAEEGEYNTADYFPVTDKNVEDMYAELLSILDSIKSSYLKELLNSFFRDDETASKFKKSSAAKTVHHGFIGGLLEHTLGVTKLCDMYTLLYPMLNRDLLLAAAMLHDIGKLRELSLFPMNDYTDEGQLLGHIVIGCQMIGEAADKIEGFPTSVKHELQHCILAHHGEYEYGSPKKPAIMEAVALNFADNTDAKMEHISEQLKSNTAEGWMGFDKFLDSNFRKSTSNE